MATDTKILFSNGTHLDGWLGYNCERCASESTCDMRRAVIHHNRVPLEIAERMGATQEWRAWNCRELRVRELPAT